MKKRLEHNENEYQNIEKQLIDTQKLNSEYNKQIEKVHLDFDKQFKSTEQFQVFFFLMNIVSILFFVFF